jgi:hypothetical protein
MTAIAVKAITWIVIAKDGQAMQGMERREERSEEK